jgi:hypothetical protein
VEQRPLHWSERAKMYPPSPGSTPGGPGQPAGPQRSRQPGRRSSKRTSSRRGFLLVLIVLLVLAAAAAVLLLWYLPSKDGSGDQESELAARSLVRQAMTAIEKAYPEAQTYDPRTMAPATLKGLAPSLTFHPMSDTSAATSPTAQAADNAVNYAGTQTSYAVGTISEGGTAYGAVVDKQSDTTTYYLDGRQVADWGLEDTATTTTVASDTTQTSEVSESTTTTAETQTGPISSAEDVEAMMLVRAAMQTVEAAYATTNTFEPSVMTVEVLQQIEPSINFVIRDTQEAATVPTGAVESATVDFYGTATSYALGTTSLSGTTFGVTMVKDSSGRATTYYVNGQAEDWGSGLTIPVIGYLKPHQA